MADFRPDMTWSWASPQFTTPSQPQNTTLPTWGAVGSPNDPHAQYNPAAPVSLARKAVGYSGLGGLASLAGFNADGSWTQTPRDTVFQIAGTGASIALVYHGYKRNQGSIGWALVWGIFGGMIWPLTLPIALAQGFAKPAR